MQARRDHSRRPRTARRTGFRGFDDVESNFAGAVDAVRSCLLRDDSLLPAMGSRQQIINLMVGLVDLAASLAAQVAGPDVDAIDQLLARLRDSDESVDLAQTGGV